MATATRDSNAGAAEKRLFDLLDPEGQERVVLLIAQYRHLMALEQDAFLQELGLVAPGADEAEAARRAKRGALAPYTSSRLIAVQQREPGYVTLLQEPEAAPEEPAFQDPEEKEAADAARRAAVGMPMSDLALRRMLTDSIFGQGDVKIRPERKSLYEKIGALEGDEEEEEKAKRASDAQMAEMELRRRTTAAPQPVLPVGEAGSYMYRNKAYQALRLAHSFPGCIHITPGTEAMDPALTSTTLNTTGIPIREEEMRAWFASMDTENTGYVSSDAFMKFMKSLERDYGVNDAYTQLEKEGERLAADGKLGFEAFAYLTLRFVRA